MDTQSLNWLILLSFGIIMWLVSPRLMDTKSSLTINKFFKGSSDQGKSLGMILLSSSLLISWIFAKSIQNTADLGQAFGLPGSFAYAIYWLSFLVAGFSIYGLRKKGHTSIHSFIGSKYGQGAIFLFSVLLLIRLWNEIWSNTIIVGQFFGTAGTAPFYLACWACTVLVLAYVLKSGFRSSVLTDFLQLMLMLLLLLVILFFMLPKVSVQKIVSSGEWSISGGLDLALVAFIQIWSYPFHDPVMTDRGFLSDEKIMLKSFILAGIFGVALIMLFGCIGVYGKTLGLTGNSIIQTMQLFGPIIILVMNGIMLTSAASTLDSSFSSVGKLIAVDLLKKPHSQIYSARVSMIILALLGGLMVHLDPKVLSATTVSGTMVIGLAPVFIFHKWKKPGAASYHLSLWIGLLAGTTLALGKVPFAIGSGKYANLLWINCIGTILSFTGFITMAFLFPKK